MRWYNLYNLKNVRNIRGGVLILVLKETVLRGCVLHFQSCINGTKLPKASHIYTHRNALMKKSKKMSYSSWPQVKTRGKVVNSYMRYTAL